jgi:hypothetical protein
MIKKLAIATLIWRIFWPMLANAQEDLYAQGMWIQMQCTGCAKTEPPEFLTLPPISQSDNITAVGTKYVTFQGQKLLDVAKQKSPTIRAVDNVVSHPPAVQVMNVKNSATYDIGSSRTIFKSEYGSITLQESYCVLNHAKQVELSEIADKAAKYRYGVRYVHQNDDKTIIFLERSW